MPRTLPDSPRARRGSARDRDCTALEQRLGDQLRVVPGRGVADAGQDEEASAGRPALRPRRADQAVELAPGDRHRDSPGSRPGRRRGCASPGWRRRSRWRRSSRGPARGRPRRECDRDGRRRWRACARAGRGMRSATATSGRSRRAQSWVSTRRSPIGARQRPAGEIAVTEAAQPARPISSATQPPSELPATWGRSIPRSSAALVQRRRQVGSARLDLVPASGGAAPKPGRSSAITSRSASSRPSTGVPDRLRAAEAVDQEQRLAELRRSLPPRLREEQPARRRSGARGSPPRRSTGRSPRGGGSARRSRARAAAPRRRGSARARRRGSAGSAR